MGETPAIVRETIFRHDLLWPIELADGRIAGSSPSDVANADPDITVAEIDGRLTIHPHPTRDIWLSQGGRSDAVVFFSRAATDGQSDDIFVLAMDDGSMRRMTDHPANDFVPAVSPDGRWITFASTRDPSGAKIFVMPFEGGAPRQLTFGPWRDTEPAWTADGGSIAFSRKPMSEENANDQIWIIPFKPDNAP